MMMRNMKCDEGQKIMNDSIKSFLNLWKNIIWKWNEMQSSTICDVIQSRTFHHFHCRPYAKFSFLISHFVSLTTSFWRRIMIAEITSWFGLMACWRGLQNASCTSGTFSSHHHCHTIFVLEIQQDNFPFHSETLYSMKMKTF